MRKMTSVGLTVAALLGAGSVARAELPTVEEPFALDKSVMGEAYWKIWNPEEQKRIDDEIERNRMADCEVKIGDEGEGPVPAGTEVKVEQVSHAFHFGAQIFNFGQLGSSEMNRRYRELYGTVFNSATVAFYWANFEPRPDLLRFRPGPEDGEAFWNACKEPERQPHWRRPPTDLPVEWCLSRGVRVHGHPLVYLTGNSPTWLHREGMPDDERARLGYPTPPADVALKTFDDWYKAKYKPWYLAYRKTHTPADFARAAPVFIANLRRLQAKRIAEIAAHYGGRIESWDVVNETRDDIDLAKSIPSGDPVVFGDVGIEGGDFIYHAFKSAAAGFPSKVRLNINENNIDARYTNEVARLIAAGLKIDIVGMQMHMFDTNIVREIARTGGERTKERWGSAQFWEVGTPAQVRRRFARLAPLGRPIHLSELTISAPGTDAEALMMQAVFTRNLYRVWFAQPQLDGITWWNVVDGCGYAGEPTTSGLFTRQMEPKPVFLALRDLICREWRTRLTAKIAADGKIRFRGFKGTYRLVWKGADGKTHERTVLLR